MSQIILVRPGQTDFDCQHRVQGSLNLPLNESGHREVEQLLAALVDRDISLILSGPCDPSYGTAEILAQKLDVPFKSLEGLRNLGQGLWEGLEVDEVRRKFPTVYRRWEESPADVTIPNAEPIENAIERMEKVLKKYIKKNRNLLIVAGEPMATLIACSVEGHELCLPATCPSTNRCEIQVLQQPAGKAV
ncbi:MAG: histidine phosphatase family protein [Planctomycetaceae bacterium]|nr:histidine phosphatase family protein [Planctomycetaceae bacterium]